MSPVVIHRLHEQFRPCRCRSGQPVERANQSPTWDCRHVRGFSVTRRSKSGELIPLGVGTGCDPSTHPYSLILL
jgi:hypothetical protein